MHRLVQPAMRKGLASPERQTIASGLQPVTCRCTAMMRRFATACGSSIFHAESLMFSDFDRTLPAALIQAVFLESVS